MRVVAALSGGVDSAVAAARVIDAGHDVVGMRLVLGTSGDDTGNADAQRIADALGIPFEVWDLRREFEETIVADFVAGYAAGRTPNPCVRCNRLIKFGALLDRALAEGFDAVCTGHYARLVWRDDVRVELHRARNDAKDQSYVLAAVGMERLARAMFPLGEVTAKADVRAEAAVRGLDVSDKPDSLDICFIANSDTAGYLRRALGERPGPIVDENGEVVGSHLGAYTYTIGQRQGLRLPRPAADGAPRYVTEVIPTTNTVVVGPDRLLMVDSLEGDAVIWHAKDVPASEPTPCTVQVRAHGVPAVGRVSVAGDRLRVELDEPMRAVAAGQALVVYDGTRVLGQATVRA